MGESRELNRGEAKSRYLLWFGGPIAGEIKIGVVTAIVGLIVSGILVLLVSFVVSTLF